MARSNRISVTIVGDAESVRRAFGQAGASGTKFGNQMHATAIKSEKSVGRIRGAFRKLDKKSLFTGFAGGAGFAAASSLTRGISSVVSTGIQGATSLQQTGKSIDQVFGKAGRTVKAFADGPAAKLGLSAQDVQNTAVSYGILFSNLGVGKGKAAKMTVEMMKLAGATGLIKGVNPVDIASSGPLALAGNTRGLKKMGIVATPDLIKQTETQLFGPLPKGEKWTATEKAMAIYAIATKNIGDREKQAAAHTKELRGEQILLGAQWSNTKDKIGKIAIPALTKLDGGLMTVLGDTHKIREAWKNLFGKDGEKNRETASKALLTGAANKLGLGKDVKNIREFGSNVAKLFGHGGKSVSWTVAQEQAYTVHHTHLHVDGKEMAHVVTKHQLRGSKASSSQSRGRNPGRNLATGY